MTDLFIRLIYVFVATSAHMVWAKWAPVVAIGYATTDYIGFRLAVACAYNYYVTSASCRWRGEATTGISAHWDPGSAQSVLRLQGGKILPQWQLISAAAWRQHELLITSVVALACSPGLSLSHGPGSARIGRGNRLAASDHGRQELFLA
jgi:hypothetical protein